MLMEEHLKDHLAGFYHLHEPDLLFTIEPCFLQIDEASSMIALRKSTCTYMLLSSFVYAAATCLRSSVAIFALTFEIQA